MTVSKSLPYGAWPPDSWNVAPLKHLATLSNGYAFRSEAWEDAGTPIIRIENLNGSEKFNYSSLNLSDRCRVAADDLLYSWSGNPGTSFGPFRWSMPGRYFLNQHIFKVSVHGCDKDWLYWALKAATYWIERELTSGMIGMVHVTKEELGGTPIPVPPPEEQRRIADFLDAATRLMDQSVASKRSLHRLLQERLSAVRDAGLDLLRERHGEVPLRRMILGVEQGVSPVCDSASAGVGEWGVLKLSSIKRGQFYPDENKRLPGSDGLDRYEVREGDLLVTRANTPELVGDVAVARGNVARKLLPDLIYRLRLADGVGPDFLAEVLLGGRIRGLIQATARGSSQSMVKLRGEDIRSWPIPNAQAAAQDEFVRRMRSESAGVKALTEAIERQQQLIAERRQALITAAVTGQFDVTTARGVSV